MAPRPGQVESNIAKAVKAFGPTPGGKKMMEGEKLAAEEAISTGLYGVWRNAASGHDFCGRIGPTSRCMCGHEYSQHAPGLAEISGLQGGRVERD
eukprot:s199_g5.t1